MISIPCWSDRRSGPARAHQPTSWWCPPEMWRPGWGRASSSAWRCCFPSPSPPSASGSVPHRSFVPLHQRSSAASGGRSRCVRTTPRIAHTAARCPERISAAASPAAAAQAGCAVRWSTPSAPCCGTSTGRTPQRWSLRWGRGSSSVVLESMLTNIQAHEGTSSRKPAAMTYHAYLLIGQILRQLSLPDGLGDVIHVALVTCQVLDDFRSQFNQLLTDGNGRELRHWKLSDIIQDFTQR